MAPMTTVEQFEHASKWKSLLVLLVEPWNISSVIAHSTFVGESCSLATAVVLSPLIQLLLATRIPVALCYHGGT